MLNGQNPNILHKNVTSMVNVSDFDNVIHTHVALTYFRPSTTYILFAQTKTRESADFGLPSIYLLKNAFANKLKNKKYPTGGTVSKIQEQINRKRQILYP